MSRPLSNKIANAFCCGIPWVRILALLLVIAPTNFTCLNSVSSVISNPKFKTESKNFHIWPEFISTAQAGQVSTVLPVSVTVLTNARLNIGFQTQQLVITQADIKRGFIEVIPAMQLSVSTNSQLGYSIEFNPVGYIFETVQIMGLGNSVELGAEGGRVVQRIAGPQKSAFELSFRFNLRHDIVPGIYLWPLQLSVHGLG